MTRDNTTSSARRRPAHLRLVPDFSADLVSPTSPRPATAGFLPVVFTTGPQVDDYHTAVQLLRDELAGITR